MRCFRHRRGPLCPVPLIPLPDSGVLPSLQPSPISCPLHAVLVVHTPLTQTCTDSRAAMRAYGPTTGPFPNGATVPTQVPARHALTQAKAPSIAVLPGAPALASPLASRHCGARTPQSIRVRRREPVCRPSRAACVAQRASRAACSPRAGRAACCPVCVAALADLATSPRVAFGAAVAAGRRERDAQFAQPLGRRALLAAAADAHTRPPRRHTVPLRPGPT